MEKGKKESRREGCGKEGEKEGGKRKEERE